MSGPSSIQGTVRPVPVAPATLAVMLSGSGRTLVNVCEAIDRGLISARVGLVIASRACPGIERARERGLKVLIEPGEIEAPRLGGLLSDHGVGLVALGGYLRLVRVPAGFERKIVNIHPALLPLFGGAGMYGERVHRAVLDAGCRVSGCTVHLVDEAYDRGPILAQLACDVLEDDTPEMLAQRVFAAECRLYPQVLRRLIEGRVVIDGRRARIQAP